MLNGCTFCEKLIEQIAKYVPVDLEFIQMDLCDSKEVSNISLEGDDLLVLSFVISELCAISASDKAMDNLRELYKTLSDGARVFYNDSNASPFYYFFNDSRKFVKGLGKIAQKSEVMEHIIVSSPNFGETYNAYMLEYDATPHLKSDALSKLLVRCL